MKKLILKATLTICFAAAAVAVFYPLCMDGTERDYLKLWLLAGIPFGIRRMFLWVIPKGLDIGGTIGVITLNFLVGGLIGGIIMAWQIGAALFALVWEIVSGAMRICKRHTVG